MRHRVAHRKLGNLDVVRRLRFRAAGGTDVVHVLQLTYLALVDLPQLDRLVVGREQKQRRVVSLAERNLIDFFLDLQ